ncbi:MAG: tetratricopeptide repeat protein [Coleofasciculaceae cyanobacterium]
MGLKFKKLFQPTNPEQPNPDQPLGGRYKIISLLGAGGFGQTFLAHDLHLPGHPQCVVKQLKPQSTDASSLETARRLFDIEAQVLYELGNHDQIPRLLAHFEDNQEFYLAQELIDGELLSQELAAAPPWSEVRVLALLQDILQVLAFVHQEQVIHRDIKPSNLIRRREDGKMVLIDFGAVKQVSTQVASRKGQTKTISIGTQGYTPKEQLGGNPRFSSDIYALGIVAIQALTGIHPRRLKEDEKTGEIIWQDYAKQVSPELAAIIEQMVRYDFRARYSTAAEALLALPVIENESSNYSAATAIAPQVPPRPELDPPDLESEALDSSELSSTNLWTSPPRPQSAASPTGAAARSTRSSASGGLLSASYSTPTPTASEPRQKRFLLPLVLLAMGVGATVLIAKTVLTPQVAPRAASNSQATVESPTVKVAPSASPSIITPKSPSPTVSIATKPTPSATFTPTPSPTSSNVGKSAPPPSSPVVKTPVPAPSPVAPAPAPVASAPPVSSEPSPSELLSEADRLRQAGQHQKAIAFYDQVIARKPNAEAYWGRCYSLNSLQQPGEAIASCNQALALKPNYPEALWSKGNALDQEQRPADSLKLYEQATALKPDFAEAWNNLGVALLNVGRASEAVAALDKATALKPDFASAWANRGAALWQIGRVGLAIASMDKALQIDPNNRDAINLRQLAREKLKR